MIPLRLYGYAAAAVGLLATVGTAYTVGRLDGSAHERSACLSREAVRTAAAERDRAEWRAQIDAWEAERRRLEQGAANAIAEIRVEYLPGKTIVRREVVEKPIYSECRIGGEMLKTLNDALTGRPSHIEHSDPKKPSQEGIPVSF